MFIELKKITKTHFAGNNRIESLRETDLIIKEREFVSIMGPSGSGKTTLLSILGLLSCPTSGQYLLNSKNTGSFSSSQQAYCRSHTVGFVFQSFNLLPRETAWRNVILPFTFSRSHKSYRKQRTTEALKKVGLEHRANHFPSQMSAGEQQRVAIARALVNDPSVLLMDEPTGNLDSYTGEDVLDLIFQVAEKSGTTIIMATHNRSVAERTARCINLKDGRIISDK